ncbi:MAG TPA: dual specificity protein phosphatase family protein [Verrucomicrobiae bacterium]|nr:dual specificity protein phosphatase family protein [Verrucomicrobiae bacterium]
MFDIIDHISGAILVRIRRKSLSIMRKPDVSFINNQLAIGGVCDLDLLVKNKFDCILDMREEIQYDNQQISKYSIYYLRIPTADRHAPTLNNTYQAIKWIKNNLDNNKKIFIHCNLGRGRGPMMACLYLISSGVAFDEAVRSVKHSRRYTYFNNIQLQFLKEFSKQVNRR